MGRILIIGAGGVANVAAHKCAARKEVFDYICIASRTQSKCEQIKEKIKRNVGRDDIVTEQIDADDPNQVAAMIKKHNVDTVLNVALPYQDLSVMKGCLMAGANYIDTANYEPPEEAKFCYKWQWDMQDDFKKAGLTALLGSGFDPGVTSVFTAYALKHELDEITYLDIVDANAGDHGHPFATNFNPEINIREITQRGKYWEDGQWKETDPLSVHKTFDFPSIGDKEMYLMYHEELESLTKHIPTIKRARFWMTFSENYLNHLRVLQNVGMTRIDEVEYEGHKIVPLKFLKALLPDPGTLGVNYTGKTCIGCILEGVKDGQPKTVFIYNVCDHAQCFKEVEAQAVSYTTGVPAMIGTKMVVEKKWQGPGVFNMEEFDPDPFMNDLNLYGLPWQIKRF